MSPAAADGACAACGCTGGSLSEHCNAFRERTVSLAIAADRARIAAVLKEEIADPDHDRETWSLLSRLLRVVEGK